MSLSAAFIGVVVVAAAIWFVFKGPELGRRARQNGSGGGHGSFTSAGSPDGGGGGSA